MPLARLAASAPGLRCLLQSQLAELALPASDTVEKASESLERFECRITSESIADAAEELAKADYQAPEALDGFAISAALTACELRQKTAEARLAVTGSSDSAKTPLDAEAATKGEAECDVLQRRAREARDLEETISKRCPHRLSKAIQRLYSQELAAAESMVRFRRLAQWQCVAGLVWRLKSTLPFVALSSLLSMVLGAFSSMRLHYQAAVINLAKDAVTASTGSSKTRPPASIGQTVGAMVVSELIIQLAEFARGRLSLQGKSKVIQELKVALFGALLRQDLEYLEQCDLLQLRSLIGSCGSTISQVVDFPATAVEASVRLGTVVLALSPAKSWPGGFFDHNAAAEIYAQPAVAWTGTGASGLERSPGFQGPDQELLVLAGEAACAAHHAPQTLFICRVWPNQNLKPPKLSSSDPVQPRSTVRGATLALRTGEIG